MSNISIYNNLKILNHAHPDFPSKLKTIENPPEILFALGNTKILNDTSIAIVGSRKCSDYGKICAFNLANDISKNNIRIVSGLAEGIDTYAHRGSVSNKTIAVIGSGFNQIYPRSNQKLINQIIANDGVIITEYFFDIPAYPFNFPKRNRIVAALAEGIVVIEAGENSGALITVEIAQKLNKKIYVVPSNIDNIYSKGSNKLLQNNNKVILSSADILKDFIDNQLATKTSSINIPKEYENIYNALKDNPQFADVLSKNLSTPISVINSNLTMMELGGYVTKLADGKFKTR
ncbi:MAG: DNA-processing protein DprA [Clostridia bacterium]|nr:DNA-processing protein DprA [bacterium]MBR4110270.1 DNA-processing protein DprA [Clostridia bacterium]